MGNQEGEGIQMVKDIPNNKSFLGKVLIQEYSINMPEENTLPVN